MTMKAETKPFWMTNDEWEQRYPEMPQVNIAESILSGVPDLREVEKGNVVGAYTFKDGLLIYHFYKRDRKEIYDDAQERMDAASEDPQKRSEEQGVIAKEANEAMKQVPWWDGFENTLSEVFSEAFKYQEFKVSFYPEVDSWSVMLPKPQGVTQPTVKHLEMPFSLLALRVEDN